MLLKTSKNRLASFCLLLPMVGVFMAALGCAAAHGQDTPAASEPPRAAPEGNAAQLIRQMDRNADGVLSVGEIPLRLRLKVAEIGRRAGLSANDPLQVDRLVNALGATSASSEPAKDDKQKQAAAGDAPAVAGFGVASELPPVAGFDVPPGAAGDPRPLEERYQSRVIEYVDRIFRRYDENKNDVIEAEEWKRVNWGDPPPEQSDTNKDGKLTRGEMCERIAARWGDEARLANSSSSSSGGSSSGSSSSNSKSSGGSDSSDGKIRRYAESLLRQYDANKNGVLEKDEWSKMRGNPEESDANKDGLLTLDELTARLSNYAQKSDSSSSDSSSAAASKRDDSSSSRSRSYSSRKSSSSSSGLTGGEKKTYRFLSPLERLPKGLPDWFARNDANGDGQIAMAEFAPVWTEAKAKEFEEIDRNGDGVITTAESLAAEED